MKLPDFKTFNAWTRRGNWIPVFSEEISDLETPVSCFLKFSREKHPFLLESVEGMEKQARYSFVGANPCQVLRAEPSGVLLTDERGRIRRLKTRDPLRLLEAELKRYRAVSHPALPLFSGGAVGYLGYDAVRFYEKLPLKKDSQASFPDAVFFIYDSIILFDHLKKTVCFVTHVRVPMRSSLSERRRLYEKACAKLAALRDQLARPLREESGRAAPALTPPKLTSNFSRPRFFKAIDKIKAHIRQGDVIQAVLSQRFESRLAGSPFDVYRSLRSLNPSPYMFYLDCGDFQILGSSPETHVRCEHGKVLLKPIAGTRPRGRSEAEDRKLESALKKDPKERAEHLMLVDLGRNDIGRVCRTGTVKVSDFMSIERYSHVMHLVSRVEGALHPNATIYDLVRATFPAGTVSGAPKIRAMQILSDLEPTRRGPYAGLVGYVSFSGNLDSCITIRTMLVKDGRAYIQAGAGIVADSVPLNEWKETHNKARALCRALESSGAA